MTSWSTVGTMSRDDALRTRIELRADTAATGSLRHLRRALDRATAVAGFLDYAEVPTWAAGVEDVADAIERAIGAGEAGAVIGLAERGLQRVGAAIEKSDDSDGYHAELLQAVRADPSRSMPSGRARSGRPGSGSVLQGACE